ncbi:DUF7178 family protein [Pseudonocardia kunmingensis]|uniref:Uncharacterized protein n=1 Tax=Pseudonocardia kunmingensis TaxID=630975 RepID=A0A543DNZ0_9PSEU|nr:hypothetical protein [Pseudonocardia kunmingensis]TQM11052.1 hypothetical protein FB558_3590 [Pseudonocardia kunmingensis]
MADKEERREWARVARARAQEFVRHHPMKVENVLDHWYVGTNDERRQGMDWYVDARATCAVIAQDTGLGQYEVAGLVAVYSVQTVWASTIVTAARVAKSKNPLGGVGSGVMATERTKAQAQRILNGDHYDEVLKGYKTNAFAHLIFYGGDSSEDETAGCTRVCIDKHAYSVACGTRATDAAYAASGLQSKLCYEQAANCYRGAADILSDNQGSYIAPHQVQATVWIVRQRFNESQSKGNNRRAQRALERMRRYLSENHPRASLLIPASGYSRPTSPC